ncbi:bifunctional isocitrate dehydrogenase kinase/phosphatase [bacterium]|nr:bifunctional isocitrate dehydrogenase kinase/phosphatase [bacterium]
MSLSRIVNAAARSITDGFDRYRSEFMAITRRAPVRFARREWHEAQADALDRLDLYTTVVDDVEAEVRELLGDQIENEVAWVSMKAVYSGRIADRADFDLAETFFNSVTRRVFSTVGVDPDIEFVDSDFDPPQQTAPVYATFPALDGVAEMIRSILVAQRIEAPFADLDRDVAAAAVRVAGTVAGGEGQVTHAEISVPVFYRGKGAYLVGRLATTGEALPFVLALSNDDDGIALDAVLLREVEVSILFSYTRSYFHVEVHRPADVVRFVSELLPRKRLAEIYIAMGFNKHGKTALYRDLLSHLAVSDEQFDLAPGTPGMVMVAFTLPSHDLVFKVIRDRFSPPKSTTRAEVMSKYRLVFRHDRAGRLIDAQEFEHLAFHRSRFSDRLLEELIATASRSVEVSGDTVVVHHVYVERKVVPLDLYIRSAEPDDAEAAVIDFGHAIKDLAATDVFPGDMLIKNFGVTRHGRVVFYDYDEVTRLSAVRFRSIPIATHPDDELSAEPWFGVDPGDVFPEEFRSFLGLPRALREAFFAHHDDLFDPATWEGLQQRLASGEIMETYPYAEAQRLGARRPV